MATSIQNMFYYGAPRRTLFLNAHNKDDYGRHRAHVIYGLNLSGTGTVVSISPGAIYTSQGLRMFLEVTDRSVDIGPATVDAFNVAYHSQAPICVLLFLHYDYSTPSTAQQVTDAPTGPTSVSFGARIVPYDRATCAPAYNLLPRDPVNMFDEQPTSYPYVHNWDVSSIYSPEVLISDVLTSLDPQTTAIQFGDVPLGYVLLGVDPATNLFPGSLTDPGVSIVTYKNPFEQLSEFIGQDILLPVQGTGVVSGLVQATTGKALYQGYSASIVGGVTAPPLRNPMYGMQIPGISGTRSDSDYSQYKQPNFFRDGDPIMEALKRIDVVLRQWMNRTGSQDLISLTKDAAGGTIPIDSTLDFVLSKLDGSLGANNANTVAYFTGASGSDPSNHIIKDGLIRHVEDGILAKVTNIAYAAEGDSHSASLGALDIGVYNLMTNVLGVAVPRSQLRDPSGAAYVAPNVNESPGGLPAQTVPTFSTAVNPYLTTQNITQQLAELRLRSLEGPGENLLGNPVFAASSSVSGTQASMPPHWNYGAGTLTWNRNIDGNGPFSTTFALAGAYLYQDIEVSGTALWEVLETSRYISFSIVLANNPGGESMEATLVGYSSLGPDVVGFTITTAAITTYTNFVMISGTGKVPPGTPVILLRLILGAAGGGPLTNTFQILGASVNTGMPKNPISLSRIMGDSMSVYDNFDLPRLGALWMGSYQVKGAADATLGTDLTTLNQVNSLISTAVAPYVPLAGGSMSGLLSISVGTGYALTVTSSGANFHVNNGEVAISGVPLNMNNQEIGNVGYVGIGTTAWAASCQAVYDYALPLDGSRAMTGGLAMGTHDITGLGGAFPIASGSTAAATGGQVYSYIAALPMNFLPLTGGTMAGNIDMGGNTLDDIGFLQMAGTLNAAGNPVTGIPDGSISTFSTDAVNGRELYRSVVQMTSYSNDTAAPYAPYSPGYNLPKIPASNYPASRFMVMDDHQTVFLTGGQYVTILDPVQAHTLTPGTYPLPDPGSTLVLTIKNTNAGVPFTVTFGANPLFPTFPTGFGITNNCFNRPDGTLPPDIGPTTSDWIHITFLVIANTSNPNSLQFLITSITFT